MDRNNNKIKQAFQLCLVAKPVQYSSMLNMLPTIHHHPAARQELFTKANSYIEKISGEKCQVNRYPPRATVVVFTLLGSYVQCL